MPAKASSIYKNVTSIFAWHREIRRRGNAWERQPGDKLMWSRNIGTDDPGKRINILHRKIPFRRAQQEIVYAVQRSGAGAGAGANAGAGGSPTTRLPKSQTDTLSTKTYLLAYRRHIIWIRIYPISVPNTTFTFVGKIYHYRLAAIDITEAFLLRASLFVSPPHYDCHVALSTIPSPLIPAINYRNKREVHPGWCVSRGSSLR